MIGAGPIPQHYRYYFKLNPMYSVIEMYHRPIYNGTLPTNSEMMVAVVVATTTLGVGLLVFRRYENTLIFNL